MTILWCGGEPCDFGRNGVIPSRTTSLRFREDYARCGLYCGAIFVGNQFPGGEIASAWVSVQLNYAGYNQEFFGLTDENGYGIWICDGEPLQLEKFDGSTWTVLSTGSELTEGQRKIDLHVQNYGAAATVDVYVDGFLNLTYTGDITIAGVTGFDSVSGCLYTYASRGTVSEFIVADEDTRLMSLKTLAPNAAGDTTEWSGTYENIDETDIGDADTIYTDTVEQDFQCNLTGMPTGDFIVKAVKVACRCTDGVGGIGMKQGIKTNGELHLGSTYTLGGYWEHHEELFTENPATSNRFTPTEIDNLQWACKSKSTISTTTSTTTTTA